MRKLVIIAALAVFGFSANAQEGLKAGINLGLPVGDAGDVSGFSIGLDVWYHWAVSDDFNAGVATGFSNAFGKSVDIGIGSIDVPDVQFIPVAASGRFNASDEFTIGADLGYAVGLNDGNDGGFYYRPIVGYGVSDNIELSLSYTGISLDGATWSTINLGVNFGL
ncbi:outer membrane beta-barrel protein [Muriicola sp. Z0-33]|uniref:outer membrane beta-barrel protein n=1 Tax=Muriicola sp. Z0-33 TaxID=2816957 RepID=UPI0022371FA8|nr:outer membrane beta-barrel protein [Muriicola sp. Z0-33]MCW5517507.1 outer membrane beta-barrel protein [Muriicola sp. Z0-33]